MRRRPWALGALAVSLLTIGLDLTVLNVAVPTLAVDLRDVTVEQLQGFDAVVHMAALSNDPLGSLAPEITYDINHHASTRLARLARRSGPRSRQDLERYTTRGQPVRGVARSMMGSRSSPVGRVP